MQRPPVPEVTAIVVCRDDEERVGHTVSRLHAHLTSLGLRAEIVAVDERSRDNTLSLLALLKRDVPGLVVEAGVRPGQGIVRGVAKARGKSLIILDARCQSPLSALGFALMRLEAGRDGVAVGGRYLVLDRKKALATASALVHHRDPAALHERYLRRARAAGLRVDLAAGGQPPAGPLVRLRDAILAPLAARAWF